MTIKLVVSGKPVRSLLVVNVFSQILTLFVASILIVIFFVGKTCRDNGDFEFFVIIGVDICAENNVCSVIDYAVYKLCGFINLTES